MGLNLARFRAPRRGGNPRPARRYPLGAAPLLFALLSLMLGVGLTAGCGESDTQAPPPATQPARSTTTAAPAATPAPPSGPLVVYSGRGEVLVGPIIEEFSKATGIKVQVRYGGTSQLAATILEEGKNSPADVFWAQDAGALGAVAKKGGFVKLPDSLLGKVDQRFRSPKGEWVGVTARARVVSYNTTKLSERDLPDSIFGLTEPKWRGRVGWAPTNGSFQAFVTALRKVEGEQRARAWLEGMKANQAKAYPNNNAALLAVASGEVDVALINHYYLYAQLKEKGPTFPVRNYYPRSGDAGALVNAAGVGILGTSKQQDAAVRFVEFLLSARAQEFFASDTPADAYEYPVVPGVRIHPELVPLNQVKSPSFDLSDLDDLDGTLKLLRAVGVI